MSRRRHLLVGIVQRDSAKEFTFDRLPRHDDMVCFRSNVEPQLRFAGLFVRTVAMETSIRKKRSDVRAEPNITAQRLSLRFVAHTDDSDKEQQREKLAPPQAVTENVLTGLARSRSVAKGRKENRNAFRNPQLRKE